MSFFNIFFICLLLYSTTSGKEENGEAPKCCPFKEVSGKNIQDKMAGIYKYSETNSENPEACVDGCLYTKVDHTDPEELFCFFRNTNPHVSKCHQGCDEAGDHGVQCGEHKHGGNKNSFKLALRKITVDLNAGEIKILNNALTEIKSWSCDNNWVTIGSYHGKPFMCNQYQTSLGNANGCCIPHWGQVTRTCDFVTWHRLYVYQMEQSLRQAGTLYNCNLALGMPYWDWTDPIYSNQLPPFAKQGPWINGPMPPGSGGGSRCSGSVTHRNPSPSGYNHVILANQVKTAYCQKDFHQFNLQLEGPHNTVHGLTGGSMGSLSCASFDPIFFLNHANIDRQYAYYVELRKFPPYAAYIHLKHKPMFPFADQSNPYPPSRINSRGFQTLNYEDDFLYKYDSLTFKLNSQILTPSQFAGNYVSLCQSRSVYAACPLKSTGISSTIKYKIRYGDEQYVGEIYTFGSEEYPNYDNYDNYDLRYNDVTEYVENKEDTKIRIDTVSYTTYSGEVLPIYQVYDCVVAYKPQYVDQYIYRLHEDRLPSYAPKMYGEPGSKIELYDKEGSRSPITEIVTYGKEENEVDVKLDNVVIEYQEHKYKFGQKIITFGFYADYECVNGKVEPSDKYFIWMANIPDITVPQGSEAYLVWCEGLANVYKFPTRDDYEGCQNMNSIGLRQAPNAFRIPTEEQGEFYYGNGAPEQCKKGWKVKVTIGNVNCGPAECDPKCGTGRECVEKPEIDCVRAPCCPRWSCSDTKG